MHQPNLLKQALSGWTLTALLCTMSAPAADTQSLDAQPGNSWHSLAALPDWSGAWALNLEGHTYAGVESFPFATIERVDPDYASRLSPAAVARIRQANKRVPLTPDYQTRWSKPPMGQENLSRCLPAGVPGVMLHTIKFEFVFTPGRVTMITEDGEVRRILTNKAEHSSLAAIGDTFEGESIGHWEHGTLVVDTIGFPKGELFQNGALRGTRQTHYVERISLRDKDHLQIIGTLDDPKIFTKSYTVTRLYERVQDPMEEPQCSQSTHDNGREVELKPPPED